MSELKTEAQLREEIIEEYSFDETDERIDKILEVKKDRFNATKAKKKALEEAENYKKGKDYYKKLADPKGTKEPKGTNDSSGDKTHNLSIKDQVAINSAGIDIEILDDVLDELEDYVKLKKVSRVEALKSNYIKEVIKEKEEALKVANATNTSKSRNGKSEVSIGTLQKNLDEGKPPESDSDLDRLLEERYNPKQ